MARIRTIKPEFWSSPDTAACEDPWARLLFIAMWNWADDSGRGTANTKELAGWAFPNDEKIDSADIRRMLGEIRRAFGVVFYMIGGRPYYAIPSWDKHQKIDKRSGPKHPAPEDGRDWDPDPDGAADQRKHTNSAKPAEPSAEPAEPSRNPRRVPGAGTGEQGNRGTGEEKTLALATRDATASPSKPDLFAEFYAAYPRKRDRRKAEQAWGAALRKGADPHQIIAAACSYAEQCRGADPRYVKHPASWLNAGSYDNAPEPKTLRLVPDHRPVEDIPDNQIDPDAILGPDDWTPQAPPEVDQLPREQRQDWFRARRAEHTTERVAEARRVLARRQRNRGSA
jgi:hypothetical protein